MRSGEFYDALNAVDYAVELRVVVGAVRTARFVLYRFRESGRNAQSRGKISGFQRVAPIDGDRTPAQTSADSSHPTPTSFALSRSSRHHGFPVTAWRIAAFAS